MSTSNNTSVDPPIALIFFFYLFIFSADYKRQPLNHIDHHAPVPLLVLRMDHVIVVIVMVAVVRVPRLHFLGRRLGGALRSAQQPHHLVLHAVLVRGDGHADRLADAQRLGRVQLAGTDTRHLEHVMFCGLAFFQTGIVSALNR